MLQPFISVREVEAFAELIGEIGAASHTVSRETRKLVGQLHMAGLRFPETLPYVLSDLEQALDRLGLLLNPENLKADAKIAQEGNSG